MIRANNPDEFRTAFARIKTLLETSPDIRVARDRQSRYLQVEAYIRGREFAVEGVDDVIVTAKPGQLLSLIHI